MIVVDGTQLTIAEVVRVARDGEPVSLSSRARERMQQSRQWVAEIAASSKAVYGINTGFGIFSDQRIPPSASALLNRNLILSHAVATGPELPAEVVRAAMLIRANTLGIPGCVLRSSKPCWPC
jgi:histidine ammonia-lyase